MIKVSSYQILEQDLISSGKTGTLYRATRDFGEDRLFVIKRVEPKYLLSCLCEKSFLQQLSAHYDSFLEIMDSFSTPNHIYLVYRHYNQRNLDDLIQRPEDTAPEFSVILDYMAQILHAVGVLKTLGIVHRDLRPSNLVLHQNRVKITGFYSAINENGSENVPFLLASPFYMSPELLLGRKVTCKSDIWSLGVIFFELVYRKHPFADLSFEADRSQISKAIESRLKSLESSPEKLFPAFISPPVPEELKSLILKMLRFFPEDRVSIEELLQSTVFPNKSPKNALSFEKQAPESQNTIIKTLSSFYQNKPMSFSDSPKYKTSPTAENNTIQLLPAELFKAGAYNPRNSLEVYPMAYSKLGSDSCPIRSIADIEDSLSALQLKHIPFKSLEKKGLLKSGGMSSVYLALYNKQEYALKEINNVGFEFLHKVLREAAYLRKNENPRLVKIYGVSYRVSDPLGSEVDLYLLTELLSGDLQDTLQKKQLTFPMKLKIAYQIAQGLHHLHNAVPALVHADLKPSNILLDESFKVFITDLGISRELQGLDITCSRAFTPGYAAPEQISQGRITPKTDIWSLGLLYYYLFFEEKVTTGFLMDRELFRPGSALRIGEVGEELHGVKELVQRMVRYDPWERVDSDEVLNALLKAGNEAGVEFKSILKG